VNKGIARTVVGLCARIAYSVESPRPARSSNHTNLAERGSYYREATSPRSTAKIWLVLIVALETRLSSSAEDRPPSVRFAQLSRGKPSATREGGWCVPSLINVHICRNARPALRIRLPKLPLPPRSHSKGRQPITYPFLSISASIRVVSRQGRRRFRAERFAGAKATKSRNSLSGTRLTP